MRQILLVLVLMFAFKLNANQTPAMTPENGYVEPFQILDNIYYVGDKWVSAYLVDTTEGLVLIDTLDFPYSQWIPESLEKLGLANKEVKYIIITHGHSDHVGGAGYLQSKYGARVIITETDFRLTRQQSLMQRGVSRYPLPKVEEFASDNSHLVVGDTVFKLYITPGHTDGSLSVDFNLKHKGKTHRAFVVGGHSTNSRYPTQIEALIASLNRIQSIASQKPIVDINLANHPHKNKLLENQKLQLQTATGNPFIDQNSFIGFLSSQIAEAENKLKLLSE